MGRIQTKYGRKPVAIPAVPPSNICHIEIEPPPGTRFFITPTGLEFSFAKDDARVLEWVSNFQHEVTEAFTKLAEAEANKQPGPTSRDQIRRQAEEAAKVRQEQAQARVREKQLVSDEMARKKRQHDLINQESLEKQEAARNQPPPETTDKS